MASTWPTEILLLRDLVAIPSVSGDEEGVARLVEETVRGWGLPVARDETGVRLRIAGQKAGPTLAFVSHLDVVPPGAGWTRDPFTPVIEGTMLHGRGAGDAKASVAAMLVSALDVAQEGGPARGDLLLLLGFGEETRNTSMPDLVARAGAVDAAVVGEPTNLDFAVAQRGLMMVDLVAHGDQRHAGRVSEDGPFTNALVLLSRDLVKLERLFRDRPHFLLGHPTVTPTMIEAGVSRNVTPPRARAILDVRSTPAWTHAELADALTQALECEVLVTSDRLVPCETRADSPLLAAASRVRPQARHYGSPTCSDWVFLREADGFKCGPGTSSRSHTPDECVDLREVTAARRFYADLARAYLQ